MPVCTTGRAAIGRSGGRVKLPPPFRKAKLWWTGRWTSNFAELRWTGVAARQATPIRRHAFEIKKAGLLRPSSFFWATLTAQPLIGLTLRLLLRSSRKSYPQSVLKTHGLTRLAAEKAFGLTRPAKGGRGTRGIHFVTLADLPCQNNDESDGRRDPTSLRQQAPGNRNRTRRLKNYGSDQTQNRPR